MSEGAFGFSDLQHYVVVPAEGGTQLHYVVVPAEAGTQLHYVVVPAEGGTQLAFAVGALASRPIQRAASHIKRTMPPIAV